MQTKAVDTLIDPLLFTSFTATYAQKSQHSDFAHVCLGFITQKQRENTSRRQQVNSKFVSGQGGGGRRCGGNVD